MNRTAICAIILPIIAASCTNDPAADNGRQIVARIESDSVLSVKDYDEMLTELSRMFDVVSRKADSIIESGVDKANVRERLKEDATYQAICADAVKIDSVLSVYATSGKANIDFLKRYKDATATAVSKSKKIGLYTSPEPQ